MEKAHKKTFEQIEFFTKARDLSCNLFSFNSKSKRTKSLFWFFILNDSGLHWMDTYILAKFNDVVLSYGVQMQTYGTCLEVRLFILIESLSKKLD